MKDSALFLRVFCYFLELIDWVYLSFSSGDGIEEFNRNFEDFKGSVCVFFFLL